MSDNHAYVTFPGGEQIESFSYAQGHGVAPGVINLVITPQSVSQLPMYGDLKVFYNGLERLHLPMCLVDNASHTVNKSGKRLKLVLKDWRWSITNAKITATYNRKNGVGELDVIKENADFDQGHGITSNVFLDPKQSLSEICDILQARLNFARPRDVPPVKLVGDLRRDDEFPFLKLKNKSIVQVIQQLCDKYGLVCFPEVVQGNLILRTARNNSGGSPKISVGLLREEEAFDPPEVPREVRVYTAPITFVKHLELHPVLTAVRQQNNPEEGASIAFPEDPHYVPLQEHYEITSVFKFGRFGQQNDSSKKIYGPEQIRGRGVMGSLSRREYLRKYRIGHGGYDRFTNEKVNLPDNQIFLKTVWKNPFPISINPQGQNFYSPKIYHYSMISLLDHFPYQVDRNTNDQLFKFGLNLDQAVQYSKPVVWGNWARRGVGNQTLDSSIDRYYLGATERGEEYFRNAYMYHAIEPNSEGCSYSIDKKNRVVNLEQAMYAFGNDDTLSDYGMGYSRPQNSQINQKMYTVPAYLFIFAPFHLRSNITGDHLRLNRTEVVNPLGVGREYVYIEDIKPYFVDDFNEGNLDACFEQLRKEIEKLSASYKAVKMGKKSEYAGIVPVALNGFIKSVLYTITASGSTTTVNIGADLGFAMTRKNYQNYRNLSFALNRRDYDDFHDPNEGFGREAEDFPFS